MKKTLKYLNILLILLVFAFSSVRQAKADAAKIQYLTCSVGEDATCAGINYHSDVSGTKVTYSKTAAFTDAIEVTPTETIFGWEKNSDARTGFPDRYVCSAYLTNLEENTKYYYRVKSESGVSATQTFVTGSNSTVLTKVLLASDIHASSGYTASLTGGNRAMSNGQKYSSNTNMTIITGDLVDRGGYETDWQALYNSYDFFKSMQVASIPGNHEYYHDSGAGYIDPTFYNQFFNNPYNGPDNKKNSSYYFKYNGALIIMLDAIDTIKLQSSEEQKAWFRNVCENNDAQWIIVGTHAGCISMGAYASDASIMAKEWQSLFEEYQVDLAVSGHEHIYIRNDTSYKKSTNTTNGVTYLVSTAASHKMYSVSPDSQSYKQYSSIYKFKVGLNYCVNVITWNENYLKVQLLDESGKEVEDGTFTLQPKRQMKQQSLTDTNAKNKLTYTYDKETEVLTLKFPNSYYLNVDNLRVTVKDVYDDDPKNVKEYVFPINSSIWLTREIYSIGETKNYHITCDINRTNGTVLTKEFDITNFTYYKLTLELDGGTITGDYSRYKSGVPMQLLNPKKDGYVFKGWYDNPDFEGNSIRLIDENTSGDLTFYAKWYKPKVVKYNTGIDDLKIDDYTYQVGITYKFPEPIYDDKDFQGWYDNPDFNGEPITGITEEMDKDLTLYAKWFNTCEIRYHNVDNTSNFRTSYLESEEFTLPDAFKEGNTFEGWYLNEDFSGEKVTAISEDMRGDIDLYAKFTPNKKKKGCSKGIMIIQLFAMSASLIMILKRKH